MPQRRLSGIWAKPALRKLSVRALHIQVIEIESVFGGSGGSPTALHPYTRSEARYPNANMHRPRRTRSTSLQGPSGQLEDGAASRSEGEVPLRETVPASRLYRHEPGQVRGLEGRTGVRCARLGSGHALSDLVIRDFRFGSLSKDRKNLIIDAANRRGARIKMIRD